MASFFSRLFGGGSRQEPDAAPADSATLQEQDMTIRARPMKEGSQFRLAGVIEKTVDGTLRSRSFIRADLFTSQTDAADAALRKGQQIIKEQGRLLFADAEENRTV